MSNNDPYTNASIYYMCAFSKFLKSKITDDFGITNIFSVGHSPYFISYVMELYNSSETEKINIYQIPFSGREPNALDIFENSVDIYQTVKAYPKLQNILKFGENLKIDDSIKLMMDGKFAIIDHTNSFYGIMAFITTIIILIILKNDQQTYHGEIIKFLSNLKLFCYMLDVDISTQYDFDKFNKIFKVGFDFRDNIYVYRSEKDENDDFVDEIMEKYDNEDFVGNFNEQFKNDDYRCVTSYKMDDWMSDYKQIIETWKSSNQSKCSEIKKKINNIMQHNLKDINIFSKIFGEEKYIDLEKYKNIVNDKNNNDENDDNKNDDFTFQKAGAYFKNKSLKYITKLANLDRYY